MILDVRNLVLELEDLHVNPSCVTKYKRPSLCDLEPIFCVLVPLLLETRDSNSPYYYIGLLQAGLDRYFDVYNPMSHVINIHCECQSLQCKRINNNPRAILFLYKAAKALYENCFVKLQGHGLLSVLFTYVFPRLPEYLAFKRH